jgi:hypothetical protein
MQSERQVTKKPLQSNRKNRLQGDRRFFLGDYIAIVDQIKMDCKAIVE